MKFWLSSIYCYAFLSGQQIHYVLWLLYSREVNYNNTFCVGASDFVVPTISVMEHRSIT